MTEGQAHLMRRSEKEILDKKGIEEVLSRADTLSLAMTDQGTPYVVPLSFGYEAGKIYIHCARTGRKLDITACNSLVCFTAYTSLELIRSERACGWGMKFRSVIGTGRAGLVLDPAERTSGLQCIMKKYSGTSGHAFEPDVMEKTAILRIDITSMTGKRSGY
jgi:uncharacterized protein